MFRLFATLLAFATSANAAGIDQQAAIDALQQPDTVLIDVRTAEEYAQGALPGSLRIEPQEIRQRIASVVPDKNTTVVLYCRTGRRSGGAQETLQRLGYRDVINAGGYDELHEAIQPR
jgi:phage shock protein E